MWSQFLGNQSIIAEKLSWPNLLLPGMVSKSKAQWRHLHWYSSVLPLPKVSKRKVGFQKPFDCTYNPSNNKPMTKKLSDDHLLNICWLSCDHMIIIWWSLMIFLVHPSLTCGSWVECKVGDWKPWGECNVTCGGGTKTKFRLKMAQTV